MRIRLLISLLFTAIPCISEEIAVKGIIKGSDGKAVENALIRFEKLRYVTVSTAGGGFMLSNSSPVLPPSVEKKHIDGISVRGIFAFFTTEKRADVFFEIYNMLGRRCTDQKYISLDPGSYRIDLNGLIPSSLGSGTYIVALRTGEKKASCRVIHRPGNVSALKIKRIEEPQSAFRFARQSAFVDNVIIIKLGYVTKSIPIETYQQDLGEVILEKSNLLSSPSAISSVEDSLIDLLIDRIKSIEDLEGPNEIKSIDFISIRNGFEAILELDGKRIKSNVGYMVSALGSLNTNPKIWKIADSLDAYFDGLNENRGSGTAVEGNVRLMKKAMKKGGFPLMAKALAAKTPQLLLASVNKPSFPKFFTIDYIQNILESDVIPILIKIADAAERVETLPDASMLVSIEGDTYEIDKGEVYLLDAYIRLAQASLYMLCSYDMDLYTSPERSDYSWIDTIVNSDEEARRIYTISGDTLYEIHTWKGEKKAIETLVRTLYFNLERRPSFMTIRRPYHSAALAGLKAVPAKIKAGLAYIKAETDDQENDLLKMADVNSAEGDMFDFSGELRKEGYSASFADKFSSIDKLMNFITELLNGPYTFDEAIDGKRFSFTINLPAWFNDPVTDLRTILPHYKWTNEADWVKPDTYLSSGYPRFLRTRYNFSTGKIDSLYVFSVYYYEDEEVEMRIPATLIDSVVATEWGSFDYYINRPINYSVYIDSTYYFDAIRLTDEKGSVIDNETIDRLIEEKTFFPYFDDYSFHGLFPGMTREKWLDLIYPDK